jgi:L-2-hydroxyglutarate oxidase LhgO
MEQLDFDAAVVGAGVVGLAVAAELAGRGLSVCVLERHEAAGRETSSRNSEVIHSGIYYPTDSLKARLCLEGSALLYEFCEANGIPVRRLGKLVVAVTAEEVLELELLERRGTANGVEGLRIIDGAETSALEPRVRAVSALLVPSTGILDSHELVKSLEGHALARGAVLSYRCAVEEIDWTGRGYRLGVVNPAGRERFEAAVLVNAAGLESDGIARLAGVGAYRLHLCKGEYFALRRSAGRGIRGLVYPVPAAHLTGLGIHVTPDLAGRVRLGPDETYVERESATLEVDSSKARGFAESAARFLPGLTVEDLTPDTAGFRPKLQGPGEAFRDFIVREESAAGRPGLINLVGIESPGLTSCLALAKDVALMISTI